MVLRLSGTRAFLPTLFALGAVACSGDGTDEGLIATPSSAADMAINPTPGASMQPPPGEQMAPVAPPVAPAAEAPTEPAQPAATIEPAMPAATMPPAAPMPPPPPAATMAPAMAPAMTAAPMPPAPPAATMAPAMTAAPMPMDPPAPVDTRAELYMQFCGTCHGADAKGVAGVNGGKPLGVDARHAVEDYTRWLVRNGSAPRNTDDTYVAPMPMLDENTLSDEDLSQVIDYLQDRDVFPQPTTGEELYLDYCSACHAVDGSGVPTSRRLAGMNEDITRHIRRGHHAGEYDNTREFMPMWDTDEITDAERDLIQEYVNSL